MRIITKFQYKGAHFAIVEMNDGNAKTFASSAYPVWRGENAAELQPISQTRSVAQPGAFIQTPTGQQQSIESSVKVPLAQGIITGGFVGTMTACAWLYFGWPKPLVATVASMLVSSFVTFRGGTGFARALLMRIEDLTEVDIGGDGSTGQESESAESVLSPFPIDTHADKKVETPEVPPAPAKSPVKLTHPTGDTKICIRRADKRRGARVVTLQDLWGFMQLSFDRNDWTREGWQERGVGPRLWKDYETFLSGFGWWKVADRPTLALALSRFCYPGTNGQLNEPNERTERQTNDASGVENV